MKRFVCLLSTLLLALSLTPALAAEPAEQQALPALPVQTEQPAIYTGRLNAGVELYAQPSRDSQVVGNLAQRFGIEILEVLPDWVLIRGEGKTGYIQRRYVNDTKVAPVDPSTAPRYPAMPPAYLGWVAQETGVRVAADANAEALITLQQGARLAIHGFEDGWAKVIYHRQFAYVDTRHLSEVQPVQPIAQNADTQSPIAAFTSFYRITTDGNNVSRMQNLVVACERMARTSIPPGGRFDFNGDIGPYNARSGYLPAIVLVDGGTALGYGGGTCQVSSTLFNNLMQLPGLEITARRPHGPRGATYLPLHSDAAVGNSSLNLVFINHYDFPIRIDGHAQDGALTIAIYRADDAIGS